MEIILNEREWVETALETRSLGKKPVETLGRIARYYYQHEGFKKKDIRIKIEDFLLQSDPNIILVKWTDMIDAVVKAADKLPLIELDDIQATTKEMAVISSVKGKQAQRLLFTLLCVAKYWNAVREANNGWVNTPDKDIMRMANVNTSSQRQNTMLREMKDSGLIKFSRRVDNLNIQILFIESEDGDAEMSITDFRNLGNQYLMHRGEPFFHCKQCGLTVRKKSNVQKYCPDCAAEIYVRKSVDSVMRRRCAPSDSVSQIAFV